jgi:hypothetical protein
MKWRRYASHLDDKQLSLNEWDLSGQARSLTEQHVALESRVLLFPASSDNTNVVNPLLESLYRQLRGLARAQDRAVYIDASVCV